MKDEGIVQAISKEVEQLSRRLHQKCRFPGEIRGACFSLATYDVPWSRAGAPNNFQPEVAAYIAGLDRRRRHGYAHPTARQRKSADRRQHRKHRDRVAEVRDRPGGCRENHAQTNHFGSAYAIVLLRGHQSPGTGAAASDHASPSIVQTKAGGIGTGALRAANAAQRQIHCAESTCRSSGVRQESCCP